MFSLLNKLTFWGKILYVALPLLLAWSGGLYGFMSNYQVGLVKQAQKCLKDVHVVLYDLIDNLPEGRGDLFAYRAPPIAVRTGVFTEGEVFVKIVAGIEGDIVTITEEGTFVNGELVAEGLELADELGHSAAAYVREFTVPSGHYFMIGDTLDSFDSRYYGAIDKLKDGIGEAWALF